MLFGIRWGSLRTKIIAWSFFPTVVILVTVAVVIFYAYQQVTEDLVLERNQELTRLTASQFMAELKEYADLLAAEARTSDIYGNDPVAQRDALKGARNRLAVFDGGVLILDTFGTVVAAEPERPEILEQNWSDHTYYRQMLRSQILGSLGVVFSDIVTDGPGGAKVIVVAVPIIGPQGEFVGTIAGMFRVGATAVSALYGDIVKLRIGESGSAYLVDGNGRVIYHTDADRIASDVSTHEIVQQVLSGQVGAIRTRDFEGRSIVASFAPVPGTSWGLVTQEGWAMLVHASRGYGQFLLLLLALGVLVPVLVVTVGVRRITRPIVELIGAAQEVARGKFGRTITARTGDEIEELAEQFNLMSAQLQESYANLEQRVADRTKELATLNAIAAVVNQSLDLDEILNDALDKTLQMVEIKAGGIYLLDEQAGVLTITAQRGFSPQFVAEIDRLKVGEGFSGHVVQTGQPLVARNVSTDPRLTRMAVREEGLQSVAIIPLNSKGKVLGTLFAISRGYREFNDQDVQLLTSIGQQIGVAIENARLFEAEERRAEQFRVISEVGRRMTSLLAVDELLWEIARLIKETLGYYLVGIALTEKDELIFKAGAGGVWELPQFQPPRLKVGREGITGWVAQSGEPLLVPDVSQEPRYYSLPEASEIRSELAVPLRTKEAVIGVLHVQSGHLNAFDKSDLVVLQSLAHQAAIAIENAQLFAERERRIDEMAVLNEVGWAISSTLRLDELLNLIHHQVGRVMDATNLYIALYHRDEDRVSFPLYVEGDRIRRDTHGRKAGRGLTEYIIRNRQPLLLSDNVEGRTQELGIESVGTPAKSWLGVPMIAGDEVLGVIAVQSYTTEDVYDEEHLNLLSTIAAQAAIAIENARLYEQARELAVVEERQRLARDLHDAVTQTLFSASLIAEVLPRIWERNPDEGRHRLEELRELTRGALAEMRTLLLELRPSTLVEAELGDLLRQLAESITGRARVPVTVEMESECSLPPEVKVALYRIAQEALNNVAKHAGASQATVSLRCQPKRVELHVSDDGRGFDPESIPPESLGLGIMHERAQAIGATLEINSQVGHGTKVVVVWKDTTGEEQL
jgi:nitrate/nitrite-specific signal transduction histidine kinase